MIVTSTKRGALWIVRAEGPGVSALVTGHTEEHAHARLRANLVRLAAKRGPRPDIGAALEQARSRK